MDTYCSGQGKGENERWKWYPVEALAAKEEVSVRTIYRWLKKGKVEKRSTPDGMRYRIVSDSGAPSIEFIEREEPEQFPLDEHRRALDKATDEDERWEMLEGHLYEPGWQKDQVCPDEIVEEVARRYAITDTGRLFYLRQDGGISERKKPASGQYNLSVEGHRWQPRQAALVRRVFSDSTLKGEFAQRNELPSWE